ncbi:gamma-glutamyltransferase [candidate division KSB1 bacterium]
MNKIFNHVSRFFIIVIAFGILLAACSSEPLPKGTFKNGLVISAEQLASQVGVDILKKGGNAVDAAIAVSYALAVTYPTAGNIGGGGFIVIRQPNGEVAAFDYREKAPGKAYRDMYLDEKGEVQTQLIRRGALACGVPGTVAGTLKALEQYGTMSREEVLQPAIMLADTGYFLRSTIGGRNPRNFSQFESTAAIFLKPDGSQWEEGERFIQKDLAQTLRIIAEKGRDGFYKGENADRVARTMEKYGGLISREDLAAYEAIEREPIKGTYRGYDIVSMSPPSSGGTCLMQILNIMEQYPIGEMGYNSPEAVHIMAEAMRRTYADRAQYLGDPDFNDIPIKKLISKEYAKMRAADIDLKKATPSSDVLHGDVSVIALESEETTHFSVIDKNGMAVALTTTLEGGYGSYLVVEGAGFLLNNQMGDFSAKPGVPNTYGLLGGEANAIAANKRMLSSMTPTIVSKDGETFLIAGAAGGSRIITMVLQSISNVIDHGLNAQEAFNVPGIHHQWYPDEIGQSRLWSEETRAKLEAMGHKIGRRGVTTAQGILVDLQTGYYTADSTRALGHE